MGKKPKPIDPLAQVKSNPAKVTALGLNPAASRNTGHGLYDALPAFPTEVLACKNLTHLEIFRGIRDGRIPKEIGTLTKLKNLSLGGLSTQTLPEEIGKLTNLHTFELAYQESLTALPASIGKLAKLKFLQCPYAGFTTLPPSIGKLKKLIVANFTNTKLTSVPRELWKCASLEMLTLPECLHAMPPGIAALTKLRTLAISPQALASIASELPKLKLAELYVIGDYSGTSATELCPEIAQLKTLKKLSANYLGLTSLPSLAKLTKLVELDVSGNKLATLIDVAAALPKLVELAYSGNPIAVSERRVLDKMMKQAPAKRVRPPAAAKPAAAKPAKPAAKPKSTKPARLGQVASINASLSLIIADQKVAKAWTGVGDGDDLDASDWERARTALEKKDYAMLDVGSESAVALSLRVGQGIADVFRVGERIVVVESIADDTEDELFLEYIASAPQKPKSVANLAVPSKKLVLVPTTDAGDGEEAFVVDVPAKISITIEPPAQSSWGRARRFFVT